MNQGRLDILTVFPELLDPNADSANAAVISARARWSGVRAELHSIAPGERLPAVRPDIVILGSGAEEDVPAIALELERLGSTLNDWTGEGSILLAIGTGWHLLASDVELEEGRIARGLGLFTGESRLLPARVSGDLVIESDLGRLVGYENHRRSYRRGTGERALGSVVHGTGNGDGTEGAMLRGMIGTQLHGPVLAKNPALANRLLRQALSAKYEAPFEPSNEELRRADEFARRARERILENL